MAIPAQDDIDIGTKGVNTPETPRRQLSEPPQPSSASIQPAQTAVDGPLRCLWCNEEFTVGDGQGTTAGEALRQHMWHNHPNVSKLSFLEGEVNDETPAVESGLEEQDLEDQIDTMSRQRETAAVERRLSKFWNIDNVRNFSTDYDEQNDGIASFWRESFDSVERPAPYESDIAAGGKFLVITKPEVFTELLRDPENRTSDELYAITMNTAHALRVWQDEYLEIDNLTKRATRQALKKTANPRKLENPAVFEDKKEAAIYGYKHDPKEAKIGRQDPFLQGGFKPTVTQLKKIVDKAEDPRNPDGWVPIVKDGEEFIPGIRQPQKPPPKRKAADVSGAGENGVPGEADFESNLRPKRKTRFGGIRNTQSQTQTTETSRAQTTSSSPAPVKGTRPKSRGASSTPRLTTPAPSVAPTSVPAAKAKPTSKTSATSNPPAAAVATPATTAPPSPTGTQSEAVADSTAYEDPLQDPKNRLKIMQSKNPKRTEAMILHWAKFNAEGRTRNPKRTKAQIEADKAADENKTEPPPKKIKKSKYDIQSHAGLDVLSEAAQQQEKAVVPPQLEHQENIQPAHHNPFMGQQQKQQPTAYQMP